MSISYFLNNPRPLKIVELDENHKFILNETNLKSILFHRKARNKPVCVISIAGAFRKGKSFLLNFFIRFFRNGGRDGWLLNEHDLLKGFHWRGGSDRDTTGIFMWSEPFVLRTVLNEEVAILLMDTQGSFDSSSTIKDCASLFALSLMTSSMQIYNLSQNVQEDDLQNLHLFSDYGRLALESTSKTAFQSLVFLIRDWSYDYEHEYGFGGGEEFLTKRFNCNIDNNEIKETRNFIKKCFKDISCFLMPHPGLKASTNPYFEGKLVDIDPLFRVQVVNFVEGLFQEKMFQIKEINGEKVTATELFEYFKIYCLAFHDNRMPNPNSLLKATAEANNLAAKAMAKEFYNKQMESVIFKERSFVNPEHIEKIHMDTKLKSIKFFESIKKMGGAETSRIYLKELIFELDELLAKYYAHNQLKKSTESLRTPFTLLALVFINYISAGFFNFIWIGFIAFMFRIGFYVSLFGMIFWSYSKYSQQNSDALLLIDRMCSFVWDNVIQIIGGRFLASVLSMLANTITNMGPSGFSLDPVNLINMENVNLRPISDKGDC